VLVNHAVDAALGKYDPFDVKKEIIRRIRSGK